MEISFNEEKAIKVVNLSGKLDGNSASEVEKSVIDEIKTGDKLIVNLEKCDYVSSAGLRVLMIVAKTLKANSGEGVLANMSEEVADVMEMTGFGNIFNSFNSIIEAQKYLEGVK